MKAVVAAHLATLGIGLAVVGVAYMVGHRFDGLSWIGGALYAFAIAAVHDFFRRGRR